MIRKHKFNARKGVCRRNHTHPSLREAKRCSELSLLEDAGEISHLEIEPQFFFEVNGQVIKHPNGRRVGYKPDFTYRDRQGNPIAEDAKGMRTPDYVLRIAIFRALFPHYELREV